MEEKLKYKIKVSVEKLGLKQSREMFGDELIKQVYIDNPLSFLEQFNNLKPVEEDGRICYVGNDDVPFFFILKKEQESKNGYYWVNYHRIWSFFSDIMGYDRTENKEIMKEWLGITYNLRELTPTVF